MGSPLQRCERCRADTIENLDWGGFRIRNGSSEKVETQGEFVKVRKRALERLTTEVMQLHDILPKILNYDILENLQKLDAVETIVERKDIEVEQLRMDCEHYKARLEAAQADCMKERKEKLTVRQQLNEAKQQLLQQAEYCTEMGAAVCTLLWSISSNEEAVKSILGSSKAIKFFSIAGQTMESFVRSLSEDIKQQDMDSDESQFVLGLAGIVTNVAALACGREFLVNSNQVLLDTMMQLLGDMKLGCCTKLKVISNLNMADPCPFSLSSPPPHWNSSRDPRSYYRCASGRIRTTKPTREVKR
uniref:heat shock factor 2-binding protein isoform X6 n=1 Tax=Podarcis muralis TaxID=64176 RepID=UPI0010A044B6|nr:heat shock factor 2-binding protein isoform X6 [Podarcis muralis]